MDFEVDHVVRVPWPRCSATLVPTSCNKQDHTMPSSLLDDCREGVRFGELLTREPGGTTIAWLWGWRYDGALPPAHRHRTVKQMLRTVQGRRKRTRPPPKEILLENLSGLKEKLSRPVVDAETLSKPGKPYLPPKSFLCGPRFLGEKEKSLTGAGSCMLSFSQQFGLPRKRGVVALAWRYGVSLHPARRHFASHPRVECPLALGIRLPLTGVKIPKIGKRGFRSQKNPHFPPPQKRALWVKKSPFSL